MSFNLIITLLVALNTTFLLEGFTLPQPSFSKKATNNNGGYGSINTENENGASYQNMRTVQYSSSLEKGSNEENKVINDKHDESLLDEFEAVIEKENLKLDTFMIQRKNSQ